MLHEREKVWVTRECGSPQVLHKPDLKIGAKYLWRKSECAPAPTPAPHPQAQRAAQPLQTSAGLQGARSVLDHKVTPQSITPGSLSCTPEQSHDSRQSWLEAPHRVQEGWGVTPLGELVRGGGGFHLPEGVGGQRGTEEGRTSLCLSVQG